MSVFLGDMADDAVARGGNEIGDFFDFRVWGYLFVNLDDGILQREVAGGDESEGIVDVPQAAFVEFGIHVFQDNLVDPVEGCRIATEDGVRQHVLLYAASALQEGAFSDAHTVLYDAC